MGCVGAERRRGEGRREGLRRNDAGEGKGRGGVGDGFGKQSELIGWFEGGVVVDVVASPSPRVGGVPRAREGVEPEGRGGERKGEAVVVLRFLRSWLALGEEGEGGEALLFCWPWVVCAAPPPFLLPLSRVPPYRVLFLNAQSVVRGRHDVESFSSGAGWW